MATVDLIMPKLGESIMEATILKWHKKTGDAVKMDETVLEIATDKVDSEVPSTAAGTITEILFNVNDVVPVGVAIARVETEVAASSAANVPAPSPIEKKPEPVMAEADEVPYTPAHTASANGNGGANRFYSPLVLNIASSEGIGLGELETIAGTGNEGRVTKKDILQYVEDRKSGVVTAQPKVIPFAPQVVYEKKETPKVEIPAIKETATTTTDYSGANVEVIEMDRMRKLIAKHMVDSKHISPHVTSFAEADVTNMVLWREKAKKEFEKRENTKLTFTPMFIDCIVRVMKKYPIINSSVDGDRIILKKDFNIGMATALPNGNLIVPVIRNADYLNLVGLSKQVNTLADNARNNKLRPDDTQGGTFTLTNVGTFGSLMGTPIINQPQVAVLAVGAIKKRPVVIETEQGDTIGIRHMMYLSLSYDHRIVDGSAGASFLTAVAKEFEAWDMERTW
ncbi:2-oxo acid dehydrogenase subunit E2 [Panacibacter ginsenosidivorans]|uniref:Dihydrolipoamide acetyltransferase component of pyruvate dehydrogenase complex n=1 Tax=Panacibacter ginsenosidivorans TaxID=1813871 RepID=A0A5B8VG30_9BACT|nr:dihydrolipoamide acetyltransferase family protein [Panacibacter ginsenosidivorans]QEC69962.1 2-oxo acid dehydrogenase subunit E2 [Panacibacter ginsenosidivorans]